LSRNVGNEAGVTLLEVVVVVAIMAVLSALAVPNLRQWREDQRIKSVARTVADAMGLARAEALRTGSNHIVFLGSDINLNDLEDGQGNPLVVVLNDADADCDVDGTEARRNYALDAGLDLDLGVNSASAAHPLDTGDGSFGDGFTFFQPDAGNPEARWVLFRPDGVPVGLTDSCAAGNVGTGGGALYIHNSNRDFAIVLTPLGSVRVSAWEVGEGTWQ
jgi:type IV fimbrial biogenesis protein FimT